MEIYGLGIVALCMFVGSFIGRALAAIMGISGNVGGVGFSMIMLVCICNYMQKRNIEFSKKTSNGILFLSAIYIPVVVAMSATQNVVAAVDGGVIAISAGVLATVISLFLVPVISKIGNKDEK